MWHILSILITVATLSFAQYDPHYVANRTTMVHLFEWKYNDIADECERFLGPMGYAGVQISPITENLVIKNRPWYERYQPISYSFVTRSGDLSDLKNMIDRCNKAGVRIYPDMVINHMTANQSPAYGTHGTPADPENFNYPGVPYNKQDFHTPCPINNYNDPENVRNCELSGLHDLDQSKEHVRDAIIAMMKRSIDLGVAGFRIDAAKHMWPEDLKAIYNQLGNLDQSAGFKPNARPFIYQEVIDLGTESIKKQEYDFAGVIDFQYGVVLGNMFRGKDSLSRLHNWGVPEAWNLMESSKALVMIDNHDNQRGHGAGGETILTHKSPKEYKMAVAFMLAHPYGNPRVMSSFAFDNPSTGPPMYMDEEIISPSITSDGQCGNGWVCEHRWPQIYHMVQFRNLLNQEPLQNWWSSDDNHISFSRGSKGFVAFNAGDKNLHQDLQTGLPAGTYCDVISGALVNGKCTGRSVQVEKDGKAFIEIPFFTEEGVIAIHVGARL